MEMLECENNMVKKLSPRMEKIIAIIYCLFFFVVTIIFYLASNRIGESTTTMYLIGITFGLFWYPILDVMRQYLKKKVKFVCQQ